VNPAYAPKVVNLDEIASLLATGLLRLRAREIEQLHCSTGGETPLDFTGHQSVCPTVSEGEKDGTCAEQC